MSERELHAYRANDELAAAVRKHTAEVANVHELVQEFDEAHPTTPLAWSRSFGERRAVGFMDLDRETDPPAGLSRAKSRAHLLPKAKSKAGREWQEVLDRFNSALPLRESMFAEFGIPFGDLKGDLDQMYYLTPGWIVAGEQAVFITYGVPFDPVPDCLTPVKLSEFYAAKEAAEAERAA